jgi:hypothetical protein
MLAVMAFTAPLLADVNFAAVDNGSGQLKISYTTTDGDLPRGIALKISLSGDGNVTGGADVISVDAAYNAFIDYAYNQIVELSSPYAVGDGNPLADADVAGLPTFPAQVFSVCMGVLDQTGTQAAGPATSTSLIVLQLHGTTSTDVTIEADVVRTGPGGTGAVGSALVTNLPLGISPTITVSLGTPPPTSYWTCPNQILGDATNDGRANNADLFKLRQAWLKVCSAGDGYQCAADFTHDGRCNNADLFRLRQNWLRTDLGVCTGAVVTNCPPVVGGACPN